MKINNIEMRFLETSFGFDEMIKPFQKYMKLNNFSDDEMNNIYCLLNVYCHDNQEKMRDSLERLNRQIMKYSLPSEDHCVGIEPTAAE